MSSWIICIDCAHEDDSNWKIGEKEIKNPRVRAVVNTRYQAKQSWELSTVEQEGTAALMKTLCQSQDFNTFSSSFHYKTENKQQSWA